MNKECRYAHLSKQLFHLNVMVNNIFIKGMMLEHQNKFYKFTNQTRVIIYTLVVSIV